MNTKVLLPVVLALCGALLAPATHAADFFCRVYAGDTWEKAPAYKGKEGHYKITAADASAAAADAVREGGADQVFAEIDASLSSGATQMHPYAGGEIHDPSPAAEPSILPPPAAEIVEKPKRASRKKAVAEPAVVETPKAQRKRAAKKDISVEAPKAVAAPRKRAPKAGSKASDIVS